jgi:hypothetical protein
MKKISNLLMLIILLPLFSGCKKELSTDGISRVTYYVVLDLTNGPLLFYPKGPTYVDPGFKAMEGTADVTNKVVVTGSVNSTKVGQYVLTYSATNADGFSASVSRTVIVYDPTAPATDLSGNYLSNVTRISPSRAFTGLSVTITKKAPGIFFVSDLLGGFYDQGANYLYGPDYAMNGYLQLNADNTLTYISSFCPGFGDSLNGLTNGVYNPVTRVITWRSSYTPSNYNYLITITLI